LELAEELWPLDSLSYSASYSCIFFRVTENLDRMVIYVGYTSCPLILFSKEYYVHTFGDTCLWNLLDGFLDSITVLT